MRRRAFLMPAAGAALAQTVGPFMGRQVVFGRKGMVAAEHPLEGLAALRVLERGGNAIDAAAAAFYMTGVVEPSEAGLGGDGFLLAYLAKPGRVVLINGTGPAPKLATRERFAANGSIPPDGPDASTVPGAVGGFDLALKRYGTRKYPELLRDAIDAAENGHAVTAWGASNFRTAFDKFARYESTARTYFPEGRPWRTGEWVTQPDHARTLRAIASAGADAFYRGSIARTIDASQRKTGGLIRLDDLREFQAAEDEPLRIRYKDLDLYQCAPNSGGITMLIALNILEGIDLRSMGHDSPRYVHTIVEAFKLAFADRHRWVADPRFFREIPVAGLLSKEYAAARRALIRPDRAIRGAAPPGDPRAGKAILEGRSIEYASPTAARSGGSPEANRGDQTSSFAIADSFGTVVSVTHSVNGGFGCGVVVDGAGFVLNNRMPYFALDPADPNVLAPGKRVRQGTLPALALRNGKPYLAWNTPGGDTIPQTMAQAFLNVVEFAMNVQQACEAPTAITSNFPVSMFPQAPGDGLAIPRAMAEGLAGPLAAMGHPVKVTEAQEPYRMTAAGAGAMKMIRIAETGVFEGGVSPAKDDWVAGW